MSNDKVNQSKKLNFEHSGDNDKTIEEEFDRELNILPINEDLQKLTADEVHHTPELIKEAGELIGKIHASAQVDHSKRSAAMKFFKNCAEDRDVVRPIRAVCLKKIYKLMPEWRIATAISHELIPESVSALAFKLP
ncbi:hypothetical protein M902_0786 [Bacteriovorax sp. BAL6_X]|uniref:hypothetical protein n=1 Tax=Bacteriovorax sp. BAL6_X TaxID=1201290 RepID=UPI000385469E|nr:hypothetical protein [Bacteriovorax sp. BAL6_X]EPZ50144.1 hypothetical protein M902_0786 [Bacteriovorax sp. BAL6_X]